MTARNPQIDTKPGDVLERQGQRRTVEAICENAVYYRIEEMPLGTEPLYSRWVEWWRWAGKAQVVRRAKG